ncbi:MAG: hypothetical protein IKN99_06135 [Bacteroidales bacterium]|nr:hypothetical protein [Bacteroidales bacterium]
MGFRLIMDWRLEMRREFLRKSEDSYLEYIKSLGCVLYIPLSVDGDLQDRISGNSLVYTGIGYEAVWDSIVGMYRFMGYNQYTKTYTLDTGWSAATFPNNEFTGMTTFMKGTGGGNGALLDVGNYIPMGGAVMQHGTSVTYNWTSGEYKCAYALSSSGRWLYDNGALYSTYGAYTPYLPTGWGGYNWYVGSYNSSNNATTVYYKDILMFNRVLTLQEVRKVQGYDPI